MSQPQLSNTPSEISILASRRYKILKKLGEGSFAKVFLAEYKPNSDVDAPKILACKIVDTLKAPKDVAKKFIPRELDILSKLNHPNVVQVHSIFHRRSKYFIFMRYAENGDLLEYILKNGAVSENQARIWLHQLASGVQYIHSIHVAHRDIKCENVLLTSNFNVKLADFGFARYVTDHRGKKVLSDTFCGSWLYAAPEVLRGSPYNPQMADIWSLGIILYIILNKAMPFDDTNLHHLYELQIHRRWKFRKKVDDKLSSNVKNLINHLLEPYPSKRWSANQVVHSNWIAMDPRLVVAITTTQQTAFINNSKDRKKHDQQFFQRDSINYNEIEHV